MVTGRLHLLDTLPSHLLISDDGPPHLGQPSMYSGRAQLATIAAMLNDL